MSVAQQFSGTINATASGYAYSDAISQAGLIGVSMEVQNSSGAALTGFKIQVRDYVDNDPAGPVGEWYDFITDFSAVVDSLLFYVGAISSLANAAKGHVQFRTLGRDFRVGAQLASGSGKVFVRGILTSV